MNRNRFYLYQAHFLFRKGCLFKNLSLRKRGDKGLIISSSVCQEFLCLKISPDKIVTGIYKGPIPKTKLSGKLFCIDIPIYEATNWLGWWK